MSSTPPQQSAMNDHNFAAWKDRMAWASVLGLVLGAVGWGTWVTNRLTETVASDELKAVTIELSQVLDRNTQAIQKIDKSLVRLATQMENFGVRGDQR